MQASAEASAARRRSPIVYESTRGGERNRSFRHVVLKGLADDGGLFVPSHPLPRVTQEQLARWRHLPYADLAFEVLSLFIDEADVPASVLREMIRKSYGTFFVDEVLRVQPCRTADNAWINVVELFHGPTFSFKDFALQFLGNLFEYLLHTNSLRTQQDKKPEDSAQRVEDDPEGVNRITVLGATSGDTGSAALAGLRGKRNVEVFVLHPRGRVSHIQEKQMTTIIDANVHNISVEGTFDDCQKLVKDAFNDLEFKRKYNLAAINSINWARILAQTVYYFYSYFQVTSPAEQSAGAKVVFSVPTGNFGNVLAGYYAQQMGVPIHHFVVATNQNDILHRFFDSGKYEKKLVMPSFSPSMDIQVSSNFERFFYEISNRDATSVAEWMNKFNQTGILEIPKEIHAKACSIMASSAVSEENTLETIKRYKETSSYILCPHSAIGVHALEGKWRGLLAYAPYPVRLVSLATASPAKFADAQEKALGHVLPLPLELENIMKLPSRCQNIDNDLTALKDLMEEALIHSAQESPVDSGLIGKRLRIRVPGSCANLGSGFDVFGIAVSLYLTADVEVLERKAGESAIIITFEGEGKGGVPLDETNFLWKSVLHVATKEGRTIPANAKFSLSIKNDIPLGRGLGSSGAAVVCGVLLANSVFGFGLSTEQMLRYCVAIEGHPDNASASLCGGFVVCCGYDSGVDDEKFGGVSSVHARKLSYSDKVRAVVAIPDFEVSTEKARQALPPTYSRADVVFNLQRVGLMTAAITESGIDDASLVHEALKDKIHQPYRAHLVPGLQECLALDPKDVPGLLGVCLSGSGSTILALCKDNFAGVEERMRDALQRVGVNCRTTTLAIDRRGATADAHW